MNLSLWLFINTFEISVIRCSLTSILGRARRHERRMYLNRKLVNEQICMNLSWNLQNVKRMCTENGPLREPVACAETFEMICSLNKQTIFCSVGDEGTIPEDMASLLKASMGLWNMHFWNFFFDGIPIILGKFEHFDTMNSLAGGELLRSKCCLKYVLIITYVQCIIVAVPKTLLLHAHYFFSPWF